MNNITLLALVFVTYLLSSRRTCATNNQSYVSVIDFENSSFFVENTTIRIPKCCPLGEVLDYQGLDSTKVVPICQISGKNSWKPHLMENNDGSKQNVTIFHKILSCDTSLMLYSIHENAFGDKANETANNIDR
jgi:hypothetical protein